MLVPPVPGSELPNVPTIWWNAISPCRLNTKGMKVHVQFGQECFRQRLVGLSNWNRRCVTVGD